MAEWKVLEMVAQKAVWLGICSAVKRVDYLAALRAARKAYLSADDLAAWWVACWVYATAVLWAV